ncbi:hypothetical protein EVAR_5303_1 [Eumeta japonica]|uniref:Uncharacterized protein n=1 Tax=Eumeta variegata TaxID=151549 RepID=A0A4C1TN34_EUMVA|nr:hypothetical protein EVAR_5303_1 [Eumeta japonica]
MAFDLILFYEKSKSFSLYTVHTFKIIITFCAVPFVSLIPARSLPPLDPRYGARTQSPESRDRTAIDGTTCPPRARSKTNISVLDINFDLVPSRIPEKRALTDRKTDKRTDGQTTK